MFGYRVLEDISETMHDMYTNFLHLQRTALFKFQDLIA